MRLIAHFWRHLKDYKHGARVRGLEWALTDHDFAKIVSKNCHYCGSEPKQLARRTRQGHEALTRERMNGIDRKDPKLGYTIQNSVAACKACNLAKQKMTEEEFKAHVLLISEHMK